MKKRLSPLSGAFMGIVYVFLYAPIVVMILFSFNSAKSTTNFESFSLKWYVDII